MSGTVESSFSEAGPLQNEDSANAELFRLRARHWRTQLTVAVGLTWAVAAVFDSYAVDDRMWFGAALVSACCAVQAWCCVWLDRIPHGDPVPRSWWRITLVLAVIVGASWSSIAWLLPGDALTPQLLAGFSSVLVVLASSSSSSSTGLLLAILIPALVLIPSAMTWHAHLPGAGLAAFVLLLFIFQHGRSLQRAMLESIQLRQRADALAKSLRLEQGRTQEAIRQQDILSERQRVTRDLHDGLGSILVSTLVALERGALPADAVPAVLRECVDDLRIVIDSLELADPDLVVLLGSLRHRLGPRLESAGLALRWEVEDLPRLAWLGPSHTLQVMRIVQEALTNVLKHARAHSVRLATSESRSDSGVELATIVIEDDGQGFDTERPASSGRGLKNLRSRAQQLDGALEIHSSPRGTRVSLSLPVTR